MINGLHSLIYSDDPTATRSFFRDRCHGRRAANRSTIAYELADD
jgi:hypothetical protein